jgi:hypothetical protein
MTFTPPGQCSWFPSCAPYDCKAAGTCLTVPVSDGPNGYSHGINTGYDTTKEDSEVGYNVTVAGVVIPIAKTVRSFGVSYSMQYGVPVVFGYVPDLTGPATPVECQETPPNTPALAVSEDCVIEASTLHYLDQRYGVCLYRYTRDEIHMKVSSQEMASIKGSWGQMSFYQAQVKTNCYTAQRTEEWRLIIDGVQQTLTSVVSQLEPFGPRNSGKASHTGLFPDYVPDPETRMVLLFPTPPSMGIPWSDVLCRLGCYEFGYDTDEGAESSQNALDGGNKDHYYPAWCRSLQTDPLWRAAADRRYQISWNHVPMQSITSDYTPPPITVDPIPRGAFARHPAVGTLYQFLLEKSDGSTQLATSPSFDALINAALPEGQATSGTTLYSPISLI